MRCSGQTRSETKRGVDSGVYVLLVGLNRDRRMEIGALGGVYFSKGLYFYVGSAVRGITKRVERHWRKRKTCRWHIDYFLMSGSLSGAVYILTSEKDAECRMARALSQRFASIRGFGCTDCGCRSHLFYQEVGHASGEGISQVGKKGESR